MTQESSLAKSASKGTARVAIASALAALYAYLLQGNLTAEELITPAASALGIITGEIGNWCNKAFSVDPRRVKLGVMASLRLRRLKKLMSDPGVNDATREKLQEKYQKIILVKADL